MADRRPRNGRTAVILFTVVGAMVGLSFASVPLYRLFCQVTGFDGTPQVATAAPAARPAGQDSDRTVTVFFDANVNSKLPWRFAPDQRRVVLSGGEERLAFYTARNLSTTTMTGTATFNVTPYKAARYFNKIDCFCFTEQILDPGQEAAMPVQFYVDPEIFSDPETRDISNITLSYTFFRADDTPDETPADKTAIAPSRDGRTAAAPSGDGDKS